MTRVGYLDCVSGIAGDMLLAGLLDAGAPSEALAELPERLGLREVRVETSSVERGGMRALRVEVLDADDEASRDWATVRSIIEAADLDATVRERSLAVFEALAAAEADVHGVPIETVHFHEVGAVDALVDVCGAVALVEAMALEELVCSPLPLARGLTTAAHGVLPLPAPATLKLLEGLDVFGVDGDQELVTPTGAALAATLATSSGPIPEMRLVASGSGAGTRELAGRPNIVRVLVGERVEAGAGSVVLVETNLDDMLPELVPDAIERCFAAGALDVWTVPAQMKKGRPGIVFSALVRPSAADGVVASILSETTALGCRVSRLGRVELERREHRVEVRGGEVRVKVGSLDGAIVNVAPEHDDCAALARSTTRSVKAVWAEAIAAAARDGLA
jgi:uncharacterized protein (TIGR00299 family) protein